MFATLQHNIASVLTPPPPSCDVTFDSFTVPMNGYSESGRGRKSLKCPWPQPSAAEKLRYALHGSLLSPLNVLEMTAVDKTS